MRVFTVTPKAWPNAVFRDLLAEGGFEVSAERRDGATAWVRIRSRAGAPLLLTTRFAGPPAVSGIPVENVKKLPGDRYEITLPKDGTVVLTAPGVTPVVAPVVTGDKKNPFGLN